MYSKTNSIISKVLYVLLSLAGVYLAVRFLLPWTAPLVLAFLGAAALEKPVGWIVRRRYLPRGAAAGLCVLSFLAVLGGLLWILLQRLISEARALAGRMPEIASALSAKLELWNEKLQQLAHRVPDELEQLIARAYSGAADYLERVPELLSEKAVELASGFFSALPTVLLFAVTLVMGLYFISAAYPGFVGFIKRQIPKGSLEKLGRVKADLQRSIGKYFKAQLIMMVITFFELLAAFFFMRLDYALVPALAIAVIDALPVFGAGTVLLPWAGYELLAGDAARGAALAVTYGTITILRSCIQAKLLGDQLGLHPIATLACIYAGWKLWGIWGMVTFPIGAISLKRLNDSGVIHIWNTEDKNDRDNILYSGRNGHEHSGRHEYPSG